MPEIAGTCGACGYWERMCYPIGACYNARSASCSEFTANDFSCPQHKSATQMRKENLERKLAMRKEAKHDLDLETGAQAKK